MGTTSGIIIMTVMALLFLSISKWKKRIIEETLEEFKEKANSYTLVIGGYDWGPAINKVIINTDSISDFTDDDLHNSMFTVTAEGKKRIVTECYFCDINGYPADTKEYIALLLEVHPLANEESPIFWNKETEKNEWKEEYPYAISHSKLKEPITTFNDMFCPQTTDFEDFKTGNRLSACYYMPPAFADTRETQSFGKHPLIIWLHGAGEGGNDTEMVLLGNKVTALAEYEIQSYFKEGAYILCIQTPTVWMDNGKPYDILSNEVKDKASQYTAECMKVIKSFVRKFKAIDTSRIYIGGCSNGGYMTMNLIQRYPDFFAAAFPVCEAYNDKWITDSDLETLKKIPIWFTAAENDQVVNPAEHIIPTSKRLPDSKVSLFKDVRTEDGTEYQGHWSWIYLFNDKCVCTTPDNKEQSLWGWLAQQTL